MEQCFDNGRNFTVFFVLLKVKAQVLFFRTKYKALFYLVFKLLMIVYRFTNNIIPFIYLNVVSKTNYFFKEQSKSIRNWGEKSFPIAAPLVFCYKRFQRLIHAHDTKLNFQVKFNSLISF